ncbi:outer membrane lipoprotein LolB [Marinobacter orientalis]|uniref:Outer-membrane lipoprotein LolB n=1 Tax=Marinobacter orientalis TaxID=1928859 RepID=A0A7Y0WST9_9GAMM|nr:lipoprotein insertase outer membrane protein LolB [Marinobacter orientalis]NMT64105.1 outer membrane lipoprotein LolB [Marinobacter orientalis]TGX49336.1 outer membrane lipoprotein LolB [Marinobacter orientalis]
MRSAAIALTFSALIMGGCTSLQVDPLPEGLTEQPPSGWSEERARLQQFQQWELSGKLAVRQPSDSGTAVINYWKQDGEAYELALSSSFLGMGRTTLEGVPGFIELTLPGGDRYQSGDPEALIEAATGWQLPINSLTWWIRGLPGPDGDFRLFFDDQEQLAVIRQQGWEIRYDRWQPFIEGYPPLPARLTAVKGEKRVRLVVSNWHERNGEVW